MINHTLTIKIEEKMAQDAVDSSVRDASGNVIGTLNEENVQKLKTAVEGKHVFLVHVALDGQETTVRSQLAPHEARGDVLGELLNQLGKSLAVTIP